MLIIAISFILGYFVCNSLTLHNKCKTIKYNQEIFFNEVYIEVCRYIVEETLNGTITEQDKELSRLCSQIYNTKWK